MPRPHATEDTGWSREHLRDRTAWLGCSHRPGIALGILLPAKWLPSLG